MKPNLFYIFCWRKTKSICSVSTSSRPLAKRFFDPRFVHLKNRILEVLISYLEDNKPKTTDWLKQLFKISECGHTDMPSYEKLNLKNYCRRMLPIIDKHTPVRIDFNKYFLRNISLALMIRKVDSKFNFR